MSGEEDNLNKKIAGVAIALLGGAIAAGFAFYVDTTARLRVIEDDLTEAVALIALIHPPSPSPYTREIVTFSSKEDRRDARKQKRDRRRRMMTAVEEDQKASASEEICDNLVDDDGDGRTDCADADCLRTYPGCYGSYEAYEGRFDHLPPVPKD
tara:strand:- start:2147 stop:2608 length:462 start_codon:yes stop_codon:yes gene_type:complete